MEQRILREHLLGKKIAGTKTRGPLEAKHSLRTHNHSTTGGEWNQKETEGRYKKEEIPWRHKSRVQWLNEGEKNTKFFHRSMIHRCLINHITKLEDAQGNTLLTHQEISHKCSDFYKDLLSEPKVDRTLAIERVTQNITTIITQEQNEALMTPIT